MADYRLTVTFGAADDDQARKRADDIADLAAAEHGTRDPVVTPVDGELRDRIKESFGPAMRLGLQDAELHDEPGAERIEEWITAITDAVVAEVSPRLERLREELTTAQGQRDDYRATLKHVTEEHQAEVERLRGELAETCVRLENMTKIRNGFEATGRVHKLRATRWKGRAERYRLAWQSARGRARRLRTERDALKAANERAKTLCAQAQQKAESSFGAMSISAMSGQPITGEVSVPAVLAALDAPSGADGHQEATDV